MIVVERGSRNKTYFVGRVHVWIIYGKLRKLINVRIIQKSLLSDVIKK